MNIFLVFILASFVSARVLTPYNNKNIKHQIWGPHSYHSFENDVNHSPEIYREDIEVEDGEDEKLSKMKTLLKLLKDLKGHTFRKRHMRLSDQVAEPEMIQESPPEFTRVLIPHPPKVRRIVLKRGKRRRKRKRIRRKLGLRFHNNFNFRNIRKSYKKNLFTRIFVCVWKVFC